MKFPRLRARTRAAIGLARLATFASRATGRGSGGMIGGLVAEKIDPQIMKNLGFGRPVALITGTNGKSTTTRMLATAIRSTHQVATNEGGDNMDAGIITALMAGQEASHVVLECDERALRQCVLNHPNMTVIANCDDVLVTSVAWEAKNVVWVSAGAGWKGDSVSCPRTGGRIIHHPDGTWEAVQPLADGTIFRRPEPTWTITPEGIHTPTNDIAPLALKLPGTANRGNATQAVAAAVECFGIPLDVAMSAVETVDDVAGRYSTLRLGNRDIHLLLAKNPAGWQEAMSMVDRTADGLVIAVNGQVADGEDLSWLWDVRFEDFGELAVKASGERGTDLAVRLTYADIQHELVHNMMDAILACPEGRVEVLANYTAFRDLKRALVRRIEAETH